MESPLSVSTRGQYSCTVSLHVWHTQRAPLSSCEHSHTHTHAHTHAVGHMLQALTHAHTRTHTQTHIHSHTHLNIHKSTGTRSSSCLRLWSHAEEPWTGRNVLFSASRMPSYQLSWSFCEYTHLKKTSWYICQYLGVPYWLWVEKKSIGSHGDSSCVPSF